ncbi:AAA family ATPase [Streptomyces sp. H10-C2]|uniref:ATP-binding protein n=1 Tax=unclassified Streptomyces TaxID=2593676 RepID=UPI0024B9F5C1|nr:MULTISPECIES: LuxR family transcriptional regulator [unclassified Streptomyces]MDJ0345181.1 AAA family ATPase [Streptomyces sp. PH10-H1]MDJ0374149.1 AAA family ATPase [Streptomyces sp. H10-C2]
MKMAPSGLFGRDREIAEVEAMLAGAAENAGSVVVINAGAGMGKTALLDAAVHLARRSGFTVLTARGSSPERDLPFGLVSRLFEPALPELVEAGLDTGADSLCGALEPPVTLPAGETPMAELHALNRALAYLASRAPVLVAVDDLQSLDRQSLRWLSTLPQRIDHARIAVILTLCPGEPCTDPAVLDELLAVSAVELHPADLSVPATSGVIERTLAVAPDRAFTAAFMREAGGNPRFVTELTAVLRDQGVKPTADAAAVFGDVSVSRLASGVHARLRRISPHALDVARAVAVLGDEADLGRVAGICDAEPSLVMEVSTALDRAGLLRVADRSVTFSQPLLRTTVIQHIPFADLQTLRVKTARILRSTGAPGNRVAEQLMATPARVLDEPWVITVLRDAAEAALGRGEPVLATAYLSRALSEPMPDAMRTALLTELGRAEGYVDVTSAIRHLTEVSGHPAEPEGRAGVVRELADLLAVTGRHRAAVELVGARTDSPAADQALCAAELQFDSRATADAAAELMSRLPGKIPKGGVDEGRFVSLLAMRTAWAGRSRARAVALAQQALAVLPVTPDAVRPILRGALVLAQAGRTEDAYERCHALVGHAGRWQHLPYLAAARSLRGAVAHRLGRMPAAAEDTRIALELLIRCGAPRDKGAAVELLARLVEILVDLGDHDRATGLVEQSDLCGEVPETWAGTALLLARGRLRVAAGHPAEGLRDLLTAGSRLPSWNVHNPAVAPWRSSAATALLMLGETAEARRQAVDAVEEARRWGAPGPSGVALRVLGVVVGGSQGLATLEESVSVLQRSTAKLDLARSLTEYGSALGRSKLPVPTRRALRAALELAEECGCADLAQRSRIELSASGGRQPKSTRMEGVASLTAAELRTAMLAAEGRTNRQLAEILLVQQRTVEIHLTKAYRKLGIEGRDQLPAVLQGHTTGRPGPR